jgi:hypothetical protein
MERRCAARIAARVSGSSISIAMITPTTDDPAADTARSIVGDQLRASDHADKCHNQQRQAGDGGGLRRGWGRMVVGVERDAGCSNRQEVVAMPAGL